jgi:hypothetical protein
MHEIGEHAYHLQMAENYRSRFNELNSSMVLKAVRHPKALGGAVPPKAGKELGVELYRLSVA